MVLKTLQTFEADYDLAPCCFWRVLFEGKKFQQNSNKNAQRGGLPEIEEYTENISKRLRKLFWNGVCFCFDLVLDYGRSAI